MSWLLERWWLILAAWASIPIVYFAVGMLAVKAEQRRIDKIARGRHLYEWAMESDGVDWDEFDRWMENLSPEDFR